LRPEKANKETLLAFSAAYPFVGNILSFGKQPQVTMMKWKEEYGDVYSIFSGRKPMVVLSNLDLVRKVFGEDSVSGRDDRSAVRVDSATLAHGEGGLVEHGLVFSQGDLWKRHRRFAMSTLKDLGMGKNWMEDSIIKEVEGLCVFLKNTNEKPFNPKVQISNSISNIMCALIFGERFALTDPHFSHLTSLITENIDSMAVNALAQALPFLMWFPNAVRTRILRARRNIVSTTDFLKEQIKSHNNLTYQKAEVQDYLYAYQQEMATAPNQDTFNGKYKQTKKCWPPQAFFVENIRKNSPSKNKLNQ
jgi:cytochrome P450